MTTLADLGRELGLSASTISRALADSPSISESTRRAVQALAQARAYALPRNRPRQAHYRKMMIVLPSCLGQNSPDMVEPFVPNLLAGIAVAMREQGYGCQLAHRVVEDEGSLRALMNDDPKAGFIFLG